MAAILALSIGVVSCGSSGEDGGDISEVDHSIEPTDEMRDLAEQQCLDDASKKEGVVQAADPTTGEVLAEVKVDCEKIR